MEDGRNYSLKPAPITCLEEIPTHWDTSLLSYLFTENKEKNTGNIEGTILSLSYGKLIVKNSQENFGLLPASYEAYQIINPGYIVFRFTDMQNDHVSLRVGLAQERGIITSAYVGLKPRTKLSSRYYYYLFHALDILKFYYSFGGGVRQSLNYKGIRNVKLPLPSVAEQTAIANFLDRKTAQIDDYVTLKEKTITLLQEQKTATINQTVTKGLNPNVPMKDSGIEWLGEIPGHWEVKKLKYLAKIIDCKNRTPEYYPNDDYFVVRTSNVKNGRLLMEGALYTDEKNYKEWTKRGVPKFGSILFTREAPAGEACLIPKNIQMCLGQRMMSFTPIDRILHPSFLLYVIYSEPVKRYIQDCSAGSTVTHLRVPQVYNIPVHFPTFSEQHQIVAYIEQATAKIDRAIAQAQRQIDLIKEYREALISRAVTGKIKIIDN